MGMDGVARPRYSPVNVGFPLIYTRARPVTHCVELVCSTLQFTQGVGLGLELTRQLQSVVCTQADADDELKWMPGTCRESGLGSPQVRLFGDSLIDHYTGHRDIHRICCMTLDYMYLHLMMTIQWMTCRGV